jgi:VCBS repeat-containing protein
LSAVLVSGPTNGSLTLNSDGSCSYVPAANYNGSDSFTYMANDGQAHSGIATVSITITGVNDAPVAADDSASTPEDIAVTITPLVSDSDLDGDSLTITTATATNGTVVIMGGTNLLFTPAPDFNGTATVTYSISDSNGGSASATVTVTVTPIQQEGKPVKIDRALWLADGTFMIEFSAVPGQVYHVQYSDDMRTWNTVTPGATSSANRIQWIDNGQPKTESFPSSLSNRFYRVITTQ